jgi:hypothetical protein
MRRIKSQSGCVGAEDDTIIDALIGLLPIEESNLGFLGSNMGPSHSYRRLLDV